MAFWMVLKLEATKAGKLVANSETWKVDTRELHSVSLRVVVLAF